MLAGGQADMAHPIARPGSGAQYPIVGIGTSCRTNVVQVTVTDPLFSVVSYEVKPSDGGDVVTGVPSYRAGGQSAFSFTMDKSPIDQAPGFRRYEVTVTNSIGEVATG